MDPVIEKALQEIFILASGRAPSTSELSALAGLQSGGSWQPLVNLINQVFDNVAQTAGAGPTVKFIAANGLGLDLSPSDAQEVANQMAAAHLTWADLFVFSMSLAGDPGTTLDNRADAAHAFLTSLQGASKEELFSGFSGDTVNEAVRNLIQGVGATAASLNAGKAGLDQLTARLSSGGIQAAVADGYIAGATVFADSNGNGQLDTGEFSATTNSAGGFTLPPSGAAGKLVAFGGTDILTNQPFGGVLTAPAGSVSLSPLTTLVQSLVESGIPLTSASTTVGQALNLPEGVNLLTYDPLAVLADSGASGADTDQALAVQKVNLQVSNVIALAAAALSAGASSPSLLSSAGAVTANLATLLAGGTAVDLGAANTVGQVVKAAATTVGVPSTDADALAGSLGTLISNLNTKAANAATVTEVAQIAVVAQGDARNAVVQAIEQGGSLDDVASSFSGPTLDAAVSGAQPGEIVPGTSAGEPGPTFTVTNTGGALTFGGTATGPITLTTDGTNLTFTRGGLAAQTTPALADLAAGAIPAEPGVSMTAQTFAVSGLSGKLADAAATVDATGASAAELTALSTGIAKLKESGLTQLTMTDAQDATEIANLLSKASGAMVTATSMDEAKLAAVADNAASVAANGITGTVALSTVGLSDVQIGALLGKTAADATVNVDANSMTAPDLAALGSNIAKVDAITALTVSDALDATQIGSLLSKATDATVTATSMNEVELAAVAANIANVAANGITGTLAFGTVGLSDTEIAALLGKTSVDATVNVDATSMTSLDLAALSTGIAKIDAITGLTLTNTQDATQIGNLLAKAADATVTATSMDETQLAAVAAGIGSIAADGITGTLALSTAALTDAEIAALLGKTAVDASVNVDAASMTPPDLAALSTDIAKVDAITGLTLTNTQDATQIGNLLGKATDAAVTATSMDETQLAAVAANVGAVAAGGITGDMALASTVTDADIASLFSKYGGTTATAVVTGMSATQIAALDNDKIAAAGITGSVTGMNAEALTALANKAVDIADASLTGDLSVANADFAAFSDLQAKLAPSATVTISNVADGATVTVAGFSNASFTGSIAGTTGNFDISAGGGSQTITTGAGDDTLAGGPGADVLTGGGGADTFVFAPGDSVLAAMDTITDYRAAGGANMGAADLINLTGVTAQVGNAGGATVFDAATLVTGTLNDVLDAIAAANTVENGVYVFTDNGNTYVFVESDATGAAATYQPGDTVIQIAGTPWASDGSVMVAGLGIANL